jgi:2-isopropylmalate synthase
MIKAPDGTVEHTAAVGNGPVNALDGALRKALIGFYPAIEEMRLVDYKVRVLEEGEGTQAVVRVLVESSDEYAHWTTVGVSHNVIEASWQALVDAIDFKLYQDGKRKPSRRSKLGRGKKRLG